MRVENYIHLRHIMLYHFEKGWKAADVKEWIASKNPEFFARGIDRLPSKWEAVIEVDGDYAPE